MSVQKLTLDNYHPGGQSNPGTGNVTQNIYQARPEFFEPSLDQFKPPKFPSPIVTPELVQLLLRENLLVLEAGSDIDKVGLSRHIAWCLSRELQHCVTSMSQKIPIKEWYGSSDSQGFDVALQETKGTTIFILSEVWPQHLGQELSEIQKVAVCNHHYVVLSTAVPFAGWKLYDGERKFWQNLSADDLYKSDDLVRVLTDKLKESKKSLPPQFESGNLDSNLQIGDLTLQEVAKRLKTPERIACFVELLSVDNKPLHQQTLHELIDLTQNDKNLLNQWFHNILQPREQLLALGLNFFNGLFDDQCVIGIAKLVENEWYRRDPSLQALDHCDLHNLHNFFRLIEVPTEKTKKYESWLPQQRKMLFEVAWDSYRVRIQTALPVMVELVTQSVSQKSFEQRLNSVSVGHHLYGTKLRREQLREVISEAISYIGLIDSREVQESLLNLALHSNASVHTVAARAMARWCEYGHYKELFDILKYLKVYAEKKGGKSQDYIMNTIALTVGYAAQYDAPQGRLGNLRLSKQLCDILKQLAEYPNRLVRNRFGLWTLRMVVPMHLVQLRDLLHDMTRHIDLIRWISESLALAYPKNTQEVLNILNLWLQECKDTTTDIVSHDVPRAALLETVALTYIKILGHYKNDNFRVNDICQKLKIFFLEENHYFARDTVVKEICSQTSKNFQQIESNLKNLIGSFTQEERHEIIKTLSKVYREQRKQLENNGGNLPVYENELPIWISLERPSTSMEDAMFQWLMSEEYPTAQIIGARLALGEDLNFAEPQEVLHTLNFWYENLQNTNPLRAEALLLAIALIVIEMQCHAATKTAKTNEAFHYVQEIFLQEKLLFARKSIVNAICSLEDDCLLKIQPQVLTLYSTLTDQESQQITKALSRVEQRQSSFSDNYSERQLSSSHEIITDHNIVEPQGSIQLSINLFESPQQPEKISTHQSQKNTRKKSIKTNRTNKVFSRSRLILITSLLCFVSSYLVASLIRSAIFHTPQSAPSLKLKPTQNAKHL